MKRVILLILLYLPTVSFTQEYIDDSNFDSKISNQSAFGDDESTLVIVEFWAKFNEANAFSDWDKVKGVKYYRCDIAKAPQAKKEYRVRMAPTIIIFKDGINEEAFKAGLDLECPVDLEELQEAVDEVKNASQF